MNGAELALGTIAILGIASIMTQRHGSRSSVWFLHSTRADLATKIMTSKTLNGTFSRKVNRKAVFSSPDTVSNRKAGLAWANAKYPFFNNRERGGITQFRFQASRLPDEIRRGEVIWYGDLDLIQTVVIQTRDEVRLKADMEARYQRGI